ncbi:cytochrome P450 [Mycena sanguinolenta]|nr:cytochrome P450 [Mycena sanguinolenta]
MAHYGELTTLRMGSRTWVSLNSDRVVGDILMKKGKITNERPPMPIASDLVSNSKRTVIRQEKEWKEGRRVMHFLLSGANLRVYAELQELESKEMLRNYLKTPELWSSHNFRYSTSFLYRVVMGYPLTKSKSELDDYQKVTMEFIWSLNRSWIEFFPSLTRLPHSLQPWRKFWADMGAFHRHIFQVWWEPIKAAVDDGSAPPSFVRDVLLHPETKYTGDDEEAMYLATSVMAAGGDNTRMTINTFMMAMIAHPDAQARARAETDAVCMTINPDGTVERRLPLVADLSRMPYLAACIKETLSWRPTVPMGPPHMLTEDLDYEGYHFPAGTEFHINSCAVSTSSHFEKPEEFRPERWIDGTEENPLAGFWGFGGGRRVCVGYRVAQQALFLAFASMIYCFELSPNGPYDTRDLNHQSLNEPFPVKIVVRGPDFEALITEDS